MGTNKVSLHTKSCQCQILNTWQEKIYLLDSVSLLPWNVVKLMNGAVSRWRDRHFLPCLDAISSPFPGRPWWLLHLMLNLVGPEPGTITGNIFAMETRQLQGLLKRYRNSFSKPTTTFDKNTTMEYSTWDSEVPLISLWWLKAVYLSMENRSEVPILQSTIGLQTWLHFMLGAILINSFSYVPRSLSKYAQTFIFYYHLHFNHPPELAQTEQSSTQEQLIFSTSNQCTKHLKSIHV